MIQSDGSRLASIRSLAKKAGMSRKWLAVLKALGIALAEGDTKADVSAYGVHARGRSVRSQADRSIRSAVRAGDLAADGQTRKESLTLAVHVAIDWF